jgi:hypothetical protein
MDNVPTPDNDQLDQQGSSNTQPLDRRFNPQFTQNLIGQRKLLSVMAQIFEWQPTGVLLKLNLPLENADNSPFFALKASPFWIPLNYFINHKDIYPTALTGGRFRYWDDMRSWCVPMSHTNLIYDDQFRIPSAIEIIEQDDMPDITMHALNHVGWTGSIQYMLKIVTNTTTQGKIAISRLYNVYRPPYFGDPTRNKTPLVFDQNSQSARRKNAYVVEDLAKTSDLEINLPYVDKLPWKSQAFLTNQANNIAKTTQHDSWAMFDILGTLDVSAGSKSALIEIWIKAGPDFQLLYPQPYASFINDYRFSFISDGRPNVFGTSPTVLVTGVDTYVVPG